jgi:hypothetical protein
MLTGTMSEFENQNHINEIIIDQCFKKFDIKIKNNYFRYDMYYYIYNNYSERYPHLKKPEKCKFVKRYCQKKVQFQKFSDDGLPIGYIDIQISGNKGDIYGISDKENNDAMQKAAEMFYFHMNNLYYLSNEE